MFEIGPTPFDVRLVAFRIPIRVHWSFWVLMILFNWEPDRADLVFLKVICGFFAILVHELGHALIAELFGWPTQIVLYYLGGLAISERYRNNTPLRSIAVSAMGPGAGFLFFGLVLAIHLTLAVYRVRYNEYVAVVLVYLEMINLSWSLFNLLPVLPLDGGRICSSLCEQIGFRDATGITLKIGAVVAGAAAYVFFVVFKEQFAGMLMLMLCIQNAAALQPRR